MNFRVFVVVLSVLLIIGCATAHKISSVQIGMTKDEVVKVMGPPASTSAKGGTEYLNYSLSETDDQAFHGITNPYYVRLINGKVDSFGRLGDFDSTQKPTVRVETDENIIVHIALPGIKKKDINLKVTENKVMVEAKFDIEHAISGVYVTLSDRKSGTVRRTVKLPKTVMPEQAKGKDKNGILKVEIPKVEKEPSVEVAIE